MRDSVFRAASFPGLLILLGAAAIFGAGCGGSDGGGPGLDSLMVSDSTVLLGLARMAGDSLFVPPVCSGTVVINCTDSIPGAPVPIVVTLVHDSVYGGNQLVYQFTLTAGLRTVTPIPITTAGLACGLAVDTHSGPDSVVTLSGSAVFVRRGADSLVQELDIHASDMTGLDSTDMAITGLGLCALLDLGVSLMSQTLASILEQGTALCAAPGPALFQPCPPEDPVPAEFRIRGARR